MKGEITKLVQFLNSWASGLIVAVIIGTLLEMILPNNTNKKYVKIVIGIFILFTIISPFINKFSNGVSLNIDTLEKNIIPSQEAYVEVPTSANSITDDETVKKLYLANLEKEITAGVENLNYTVNNINVQLESGQTYGNIDSVTLNVEPKNKVEIVEKINIAISEDATQTTGKSKLSQGDINTIKDFLYTNYGINKDKINLL
ncbi:MAG: stage III sporulation protein AF [Oscillospiraceae bacterium]|nr:stage III sporulation protein AF [Oscillospiraceae bacterium]